MAHSKLTLFSTPAILLLTLSLFLVFMTANATTPLYTYWQTYMHYSTGGLSIIFISYNIGVMAALFLVRHAQQSHNIKRLLAMALIGTIIAILLFIYARHFWQLLLARFIVGLSCGTFVSCGTSLILKIGLKQQIHQTPLFVTLACVFGFGIGPFYAGIFVDYVHNPVSTIFIPLLFLILLCFLILLRCKTDERPHLSQQQAQENSQTPHNYPMAFVSTALFAGPFALAGLFISLGPSMMIQTMHTHSHTLIGSIILLLFGCGVVSQLILKNHSVSRQILIGVVTSFLGGTCILVAEVNHWEMLMILAAILIGVAQSMTQLAGTHLIKQFQPMGTLQRSTSTFFFGGYLMVALSIVTMGWVSNRLGIVDGSIVFLYLCFMLIAAGTGGYILLHRQESFGK
ncbi:MAG: hypothetical protein CENE_03178 [Candidatus Celerinatantimonas neptuna]|nr:MAG: hypothetical protein CENE_03178 [Candidatus Celerinatantimonas neptuna]